MYSCVQGIDLRLLHIFATIAECQGFSAAQAQLNMNQSTISTHMSTLETRLGYRLCERGRSGFHLTEEGKRILRATHELFACHETFVATVRSLSGRLFGELSIGLLDNTITLKAARLSQALARFYQRDQDVCIQFFVKSPTELEQAVLDGQIHAAITYIGHRLTNLDYIDLFDEQVSVYCGEAHPLFYQEQVSIEEIENCQWVKRGYLLPSHLLPLSPTRLTAVAHQMEAVAHLVLAGSHLGYLPQHYAEHWIERGQMRILGRDALSYEVKHSLIVRRNRPNNEALDAFIADVVAEHPNPVTHTIRRPGMIQLSC